LKKMHTGNLNGERDKHGWFKPGQHSYATLLHSKAVDLLAKSFPENSRAGNLYQFKWFLDHNSISPEELLSMPEKEIKKAIVSACITKNSEGTTSARRIFYVVLRYLALNGKPVDFTRQERKTFLRRTRKKLAQQYIPSKEDVFRMSDSFPNKGDLQQKRGKALILSLWQSGVRASCLCSWTWAMFKDKLYPTIQTPVPIKVVSERPEDVYDVAVDNKLSSYDVSYYYTFLHQEAAQAVKDYLEERLRHGWKPKDSDPIFVTEAISIRGTPLKAANLTFIVKTAAKQIGLNPSNIWTHCMRKAFRKTLYSSGVDPDVAEALMGHKLGASRGSYFDYHDLSFAKTEYLRGHWDRISLDRVRALEEEIGALRTNGQTKTQTTEKQSQEITDLKTQVETLNKQYIDLMKRLAKTEYKRAPPQLDNNEQTETE
jgi:integrase